VDLSAIAAEAAREAGALSSEHPLSLDLPGPVMVNGVGDDLHRLAGNLIENALIHTPPGTPVTVSVRRMGNEAVLEVADRGPGVPLSMREQVFERFARGGGDAAPMGSSGLGLAIVRAVTDSHGGRVELSDAEGGGARFVITLPAADTTRSDGGDSVLVQPSSVPETSKEQQP
jgi:two-component system OmpR family sensor kinase